MNGFRSLFVCLGALILVFLIGYVIIWRWIVTSMQEYLN